MQTHLLPLSSIAAGALLFSATPRAAAQTDPTDAPATIPLFAVGYDAEHGHHTGHHVHSSAPIGVMGAHVHSEGEWMLSLRYMRMEMDGLLEGDDGVSSQAVLGQGFMVTPTKMEMEMIMLGGMYAPSDDLTLMVMLPYLRNRMDHVTGMGTSFETESAGLGDLRITGLFPVHRTGNFRPGHIGHGDEGGLVHLEGGLSLPTGSTDERDATPASPNAKLPYPMQLGSGTTDLVLGATAQRSTAWGGYGIQGRGIVRLGENDEDYTLGGEQMLTGWATYGLADQLDLSGRLAYHRRENIDGADPDLNPNMVPTADPDRQARQRLELGAGLRGTLGGAQLSAEVLVPFWEDVDGPALELDITAVFGVQLAF